MRLIGTIVSILVLSAVPGALAGEEDATAEPSQLTVSGVVDFNMGQLKEGYYRVIPHGFSDEVIQFPHLTTNQWFGTPLARLNLDFKPAENLQVLVGFEGSIFLNTLPYDRKSELAQNGGSPLLPQFMGFGLHQAQGIFSLYDGGTSSLHLSVGLMPYKYNPEVRNLGEFLFRSGTYPFFLVNEFNFPLQRLSGVLLNYTYDDPEAISVKIDQFLRFERNFAPLNDLSVTTIAGIDWKKIVNVGFGVDFSRLVEMNGTLTTPKGGAYPSAVGSRVNDISGETEYFPVDTAGYYSFKGTKVMARATIDPLGAMRGNGDDGFLSELLGKNGGKIYGEAAVVGLKNYPANPLYQGASNVTQAEANYVIYQINPWGYTKISERMPYMVGINLPLWKLLDVCAFELEKYPAPYPNDYFQALYNNALPIPTWSPYVRNSRTITDINSGETWEWVNPLDSASYSGPRWYWSLYMKKSFGDNISLYGQVARDHQRWDINLGNTFHYSSEEIMAAKGQWAWRSGLLYEF